MPAIGLAEAARLTGKNQSTIHRAMKAGWLSYTKGEAGERKVDVAELERVFGLRRDGSVIAIRVNGASRRTGAHPSKSHDTHVVDAERVIAAQRETIARQDTTIADLRTRLDSLMALLTDQRARPWWRRWFR
jgi:hypothetical protein